MTDYQRLKRVIFWLLSQGYAETQEEIAISIDGNPSYLSQVVKGKKIISDKFVNKLCGKYEKVNPIWILKGEGSMLINKNEDDCDNCKVKNEKIKALNNVIEHYEDILGIKKPDESKKESCLLSTDGNLAV